jgi:hypothetical protein
MYYVYASIKTWQKSPPIPQVLEIVLSVLADTVGKSKKKVSKKEEIARNAGFFMTCKECNS